ncbi:hypothetical protein MUK70_12810 [Dyadobacter chenwenxiniae]|uniref:Phage gp6-like head-tail connector protein n=1 Tax=Dyadobacter chenwenxiniae TaxID=2906456 RepID=A0A9X1PHH0_9BACT|nr:hypothetical protein [Dyadobacter chenwenxiniae]MCF0060124.1 hypothetical protein [Dyadobacter chenwenxiniae]UON85862.1 hypothetical protein MUK70_12810 [Dyadobacter chenwenxiniae]
MSYPYLVEKYGGGNFSIDDGRRWIRMDIPGYDECDDDLAETMHAALDYVETECNVSLGISTYEWYTENLPCTIPDATFLKEIVSIEGFKDGMATAIATTNYALRKVGAKNTRIIWNPSFNHQYEHFIVKFKAGMGPEEIPPRMVMAIRILVGEWDTNRIDLPAEKKTMVDRLLSIYVIPRCA